jgi:hypothetical protein
MQILENHYRGYTPSGLGTALTMAVCTASLRTIKLGTGLPDKDSYGGNVNMGISGLPMEGRLLPGWHKFIHTIPRQLWTAG